MNKFYDVHMHSFNLSHPNLLMIIKRLDLGYSPFVPILNFIFPEKRPKIENMLAIFENDIGSQFLILEHYIKNDERIYKNGKLTIGGMEFDKIVLTPLIMDFGYKVKNGGGVYYRITPEKPIVNQITDLFNGIRKYYTSELFEKNDDSARRMDIRECGLKKENKLFEIYPFMGINTRNYSFDRVKNIFDKYFSEYNGLTEKYYDNLGKFDGNIESLGSNAFAGVKLYPPLGFEPWPDSGEERVKAEYIYKNCEAKNIPVTVHCAEGGFNYGSKDFSAPENWEYVLKNYPKLKINFAHYGGQNNRFFFFKETKWRDKVIEYINHYDNVYSDFSYRDYVNGFYGEFREKMESNIKMKDKMLFGTDFMICLLEKYSYNEFLEKFSKNEDIGQTMKMKLCNINSKQFLNVKF